MEIVKVASEKIGAQKNKLGERTTQALSSNRSIGILAKQPISAEPKEDSVEPFIVTDEIRSRFSMGFPVCISREDLLCDMDTAEKILREQAKLIIAEAISAEYKHICFYEHPELEGSKGLVLADQSFRSVEALVTEGYFVRLREINLINN